MDQITIVAQACTSRIKQGKIQGVAMKPIGDITVVTCILYLKFISIDICKNLLRIFLVVEQLNYIIFFFLNPQK